MKKDAHYYAILAFCRACGFKKESAGIVAYASQFVDDAKINHIALKNYPRDIEYDNIDGQPSFFNMATCHSYTRVKTFNYSAMINNTCAFHFVPGCEGENFSKKLRCKKESPIILKILDDVLEEDDLVKLGIVLHAYADSFSHQGFSGLISKVNDIKNCKILSSTPWIWSDKFPRFVKWLREDRENELIDRLTDTTIPAYGHGQAMVYPDLPYLKWSYEYDYSDHFSTQYKSSGKIDNKHRFRTAFNKIKSHLEEYLNRHDHYKDKEFGFQNFGILFETLLAKKTDWQRESNWKKTLLKQELFLESDPEFSYVEERWLKEAFKNFERQKFNRRKVVGVELASDFINSNWYKYYRAVKWYKNRILHYCEENGLTIPT